MDRSRKYVQMCTLAQEIQRDWVPGHGDFFVGRQGRVEAWVEKMQEERNVYQGVDLSFADGLPRTTRYIWLPRLDQLIELAQKPGIRYEIMTQSFFDWTKRSYPHHSQNPRSVFDSLEKIWLAFIMHKDWGKIWAGQNWELLTTGSRTEKNE